MSEGLDRSLWTHTAQLSAMIANSVRDPKKRRRSYEMKDFYPFRLPKVKPPVKVNVRQWHDMMKARNEVINTWSGQDGQSGRVPRQ